MKKTLLILVVIAFVSGCMVGHLVPPVEKSVVLHERPFDPNRVQQQ